MIRSTTDEMLAARHDPEPWLNRAGQRALVAPGDYAPHGWVFDPRVEYIPSRDPYPWAREDIYGNVMADRASIRRPDLHGAKDAWHPRPEYARPEPNPILVDVRKYRAERLAMNNPKGWAHVLRKFESAVEANPWDATPAQIEDARKVLTRLVEVFG